MKISAERRWTGRWRKRSTAGPAATRRRTPIEENERGTKERSNRYHVPGDVRAMIFWLQSRRPDKWKTKAEAEGTEEAKGVNIVDDIA